MARRLTLKQQWILAFLAENPGATLRQIADGSPVDHWKTFDYRERNPTQIRTTFHTVTYGTAQNLIVRLIERGLVRRDPDGVKERLEPGRSYKHFLKDACSRNDDPLEQAFALEWKP